MNLCYDINVGYGIRVKRCEAEGDRPAGYVVEIHFYDGDKAVQYVDRLITAATYKEKGD